MRPLSPEERALWQKVVASVRPLHAAARPADPVSRPAEPDKAPSRPVKTSATPRKTSQSLAPAPGTTLDGSWDRRLSRGLVQPDAHLDLHGRNLGTAYDLLDERLEHAIASGARVLLLITGKPPADDRRPVGRGAIRAAVGDWLAASRHARDIAAVRNAHPRHGGAGALYIVLRRRRDA
jgi:DNA-nicking Smr family endonuclease